MRRVLLVVVFFGFSLGSETSLFAQDADTCLPVSPTSQVVVTLNSGTKVRGTLLCLGQQEVRLAGEGTVNRHPLADVRRIDKPRDGVNDGFLKGAAVGLIFWGVICPKCEPEYMLRSTLTYAFIGLAFDALQGNSKTIYRSGNKPAASVAWRVRF